MTSLKTTEPTIDRPSAPSSEAERPWLVVLAREVHVKLTDKTFLFSTVFTIVLLLAGTLLSGFLATRTSTYDLGVVGQESGAVSAAITKTVESGGDELKVTKFQTQAELEAAIADKDIDAGLTTEDDVFTLIGGSSIDSGLQQAVTEGVHTSVLAQNAKEAGTTLESLNNGTEVKTTLLEGDSSQALVAKVAGFVFAFLFYMASLLFGMAIANSILEEKQNRVVEILAAAVPIRQILYGKVLGNSVLAFAQIAVFAIVGLVGVNVSGLSLQVGYLLSAAAWFVGFFVVGFLALAAIWAALGAMASRSEDLQSSTGPVIGVLVAALFIGIYASGPFLTVVSFVPIISSIAMPMRLVAGTVPLWQPIVSLLLTIAAAYGLVRLAEKIYRRAILHSGAALSWKKALKLED